MRTSPSRLKLFFIGMGCLGLAAVLFGLTLQAIISAGHESEPQLVVAEDAEGKMHPPEPSTPSSFPYNTVVLSWAAGVSEEGAVATLRVREEACELTSGKVRMLQRQGPTEVLDLLAAGSACLAVHPNNPLASPRSVVGDWYSPATAELPEFESKVWRWMYVAPDSDSRAVHLVALGYCADAEAACYGGVALEEDTSTARPYVLTRFPDYGVTPLVLH